MMLEYNFFRYQWGDPDTCMSQGENERERERQRQREGGREGE